MKRVFFTILVLALAQPAFLFAQTHSSNSYQVNEATFGSGGSIDTNSASYNARGSIGDMAVGDSSSTSYAAVAGSISPDQEYLAITINTGTVDLGTLSTSSTGIGEASFSVNSYINGSYAVKTMSQSLKNGTAYLAPMTAGGASSQGTEQFGINLVANTAPTNGSFPTGAGVNPAHQPNSSYANGIAASGYDTVNNYKYNAGDTIASSGSGRAWGQTNFVISYIANISAITPGGLFTSVHDLVVVPSF